MTSILSATELWKELQRTGQTVQTTSQWEGSVGTTGKEKCVLNHMLTHWPCWPRLDLKEQEKVQWFGGRAPKQTDTSREEPDISLRVGSVSGRSCLKQATRPSWPLGAKSPKVNLLTEEQRVCPRTKKSLGSKKIPKTGWGFNAFIMKLFTFRKQPKMSLIWLQCISKHEMAELKSKLVSLFFIK